MSSRRFLTPSPLVVYLVNRLWGSLLPLPRRHNLWTSLYRESPLHPRRAPGILFCIVVQVAVLFWLCTHLTKKLLLITIFDDWLQGVYLLFTSVYINCHLNSNSTKYYDRPGFFLTAATYLVLGYCLHHLKFPIGFGRLSKEFRREGEVLNSLLAKMFS